jgi:hypothetical protein
MKMLATGWVTGLLILGSAGCASALEPVDQSNPGPPTQPERPMIPTLESIIESVLEDAATRTGIARADLKVESAISVTWPDGSLGCPQPGMNYTMALVPGYRITVQAGEQVLDYHASRRGYFVLCPAGMALESIVDDSM